MTYNNTGIKFNNSINKICFFKKQEKVVTRVTGLALSTVGTTQLYK